MAKRNVKLWVLVDPTNHSVVDVLPSRRAARMYKGLDEKIVPIALTSAQQKAIATAAKL